MSSDGRRKNPVSRVDSRGQGNFELVANFGYDSRGSADPRESLRKRRISKLTLTAHKVLPHPGTGSLSAGFHVIIFIKIRCFLRIFLSVSFLNNNHCICSTIIYTELIFRWFKNNALPPGIPLQDYFTSGIGL